MIALRADACDRVREGQLRKAGSRAPLTPTLSPGKARERGVKAAAQPAGLSSHSTLQLSRPRSGCASSAGQHGPLLYPGPLCGGESWTTGRAAGVDRDVDSFSPGQATAWMPELRQRRSGCPMSGRKARPRLTDLPHRDRRQAPSGVAYTFGYFSLGHSREK
jgi:hypothetical protein